MISCISAPAQCRASMARKAAFGSAMHIWKALCAATQAAPIFCRKIVSRFAKAAKLPVI